MQGETNGTNTEKTRRYGHRQRQKAAAPADDPGRGGPDRQSAVQHRGPYLHRPHPRHRRSRADRRGPVHPHPDAAERLRNAHRCRWRAPHRHRHGPGRQRPGGKDRQQQLHHAADLLGAADRRVLCRRTGPAADVRCQRRHPALCAGVQPHLHPRLGLRPHRAGHEPLHHRTGLCQDQYADHRHRCGHQHRARPHPHLPLWSGGAGCCHRHRA